MSQTADVFVAGIPLPPQELLFMDKTQEAGLAHGQRMIRQLDQLVDLDGGLFFDIGCGWGRAAYGLVDANFNGKYVGFDLLPTHIKDICNGN